MSVEMKHVLMSIPTYIPAAPIDLPMFLEKKAHQGAKGQVYPLPYTDTLSNEPVDKEWHAVILKNEHIEVTLLPQLGGKIHGARDLHNGYEFIYQNTVIKPAMVGLAGPWVSGGVEFNWPQHHRPTTFMPLEATFRDNADGSKTCIMGEAEPFQRMRAQVAVTVRPGSSVVEASATVYNNTDKPLPFMWWNNLAVRVHEKYKACFPPDVEWGNDHDRRAVISFPVMKGVYNTARPFDYGSGTDATWFSNVKLPTSVMISKGQSDMDFLGGYDFAADAGTVTVSDHRVSPGKKLWTWGDGPFGKAWSANLTDNGDRYIELMTGAYTDNQPDFTWIMPGECRKFTQVWFPIRGIGEPKNASVDGALSFDIIDGLARVGGIATREIPNAVLTLTCNGKEILRLEGDVSPEKHLHGEALLPEGVKDTDCTLALLDGHNKRVLVYQPTKKGGRIPPRTRSIPPRPQDVESLEALYLYGAHLVQYKHHTYEPAAYFLEALRRDSKDYRSNMEMGRLLMEKGEYTQAKEYLEKAVNRIREHNDNPEDTTALYLLARLKRLMGDIDGAYEDYTLAAWQYTWRAPAMYEMACIDAARKRTSLALEELTECLVCNGRHYAARILKGYLEENCDIIQRVMEEVPQDAAARFALHFMEARPLEAYLLNRPEDCLDAALQFERAGFTLEAEKCLALCTRPNMLVKLHLYRLTGRMEQGDMYLCFPNRLEDIPALSIPDGRAQYLLGCLYYDRMNYTKALRAWEKAHTAMPDDAFTCRNLALAYFDHFGQANKARQMMERALTLAPDNARILYELLQLYKNINRSPAERIALLEAHQDLVKQRDDCFLEQCILYTQLGYLEKAKDLLLSKRFNIYEGGEGKLTRHHGWLYTLLGCQALEKGDVEDALKYYQNALIFPDNYGEGRHYSAQEANCYYYTGLLQQQLGNNVAAREAFEKAAAQPSFISEITYFAAKAMEKLGRTDAAMEVFSAMRTEAENKMANADLYGYFGVGMPAPLPFELNVERQNRITALLLTALASDGLGDVAARDAALDELNSIDPWGTPFAFFQMLGILKK